MSNLFNIPEVDEEEWRDVVGFEDSYQVSNLGRVRSKQRKLHTGKTCASQLLACKGADYQVVQLWRNNKGHNKLVHRLVAEAFLLNPDNLPEVNHKDNNPKNNNVQNLEWVSIAYNVKQKNANRPKGKSYKTQVKCLETGEIFDSISAAGRSVTADATQIVESILNQRCCKGKTFVYADQLPEDEQAYMLQAQSKYQSFHRRPQMKNCRKVLIVETGQEFDSIATAARFFHVDTATITNRIKAAKTFDGLTLKYIENN